MLADIREDWHLFGRAHESLDLAYGGQIGRVGTVYGRMGTIAKNGSTLGICHGKAARQKLYDITNELGDMLTLYRPAWFSVMSSIHPVSQGLLLPLS